VAGKRRALLISTDTYQDSAFRQLDAPNADAEALGAVLADPAIGAYEVKVLNNSASHQVNQAIDDFFDTASLEDQIILYFSGHGFKDDKGRLYLITTDSRRRLLASTAVSAQFIREQLDQCRSRRKIVVLDCCYAGAFPDGATRGNDGIDVLERLSGRGSAVITAASAIGYALEGGASPSITEISEVTPSVFTGAFIEGLATGSADQDGDGLIDIDELYEYVYKKVREAAPEQTPGRRGNIEGTLYVATSPRGPRPAQLPAEFGDAVQNPLPSIRLAVVRDLVTLCSGAHPGTIMAVHAALTQLAEDDSRRVATAARSALDAIDERAQSIGIRDKTTRRTSRVAPKAAQEEADRVRAEAREQAERMLTAAQEQAERAIMAARAEAEKTLNAARTEADEMLTKADHRAQQISSGVAPKAAQEEADRVRAEAREQAERMLTAAQEQAERAIMAARAEAGKTLNTARTEADKMLTKARRQAEQITGDARVRVEALERDAQERHRQAMGTLVKNREEIEQRVDDLRAFEREYRSRLKVYLEGQLRDLLVGVTDL
jgi:cell division septum initiation protein DivIVA